MVKTILYWTPRILGILAILFIMMFSMDYFGEYEPFDKQMTCFFMHNIPAFVWIVILIIAWKWEMIGDILFILTFVAAGIFYGSFTDNIGLLIVISPFLVTGILFVIHFLLQKKKVA